MVDGAIRNGRSVTRASNKPPQILHFMRFASWSKIPHPIRVGWACKSSRYERCTQKSYAPSLKRAGESVFRGCRCTVDCKRLHTDLLHF